MYRMTLWRCGHSVGLDLDHLSSHVIWRYEICRRYHTSSTSTSTACYLIKDDFAIWLETWDNWRFNDWGCSFLSSFHFPPLPLPLFLPLSAYRRLVAFVGAYSKFTNLTRLPLTLPLLTTLTPYRSHLALPCLALPGRALPSEMPDADTSCHQSSLLKPEARSQQPEARGLPCPCIEVLPPSTHY